MVSPRTRGQGPSAASGERGFSFLEILIVMAMIAVLAGLGIGLMQNLGAASRLVQARAVVLETAFACKGSSNGGTRATFLLREGPTDAGPRVFAEALAARPVLTADFESLDFVSQGYPLLPHGGAQVDPDPAQGWAGRALKLARGAWLEIPAQAAFAMTEGIEVDVQVRTEGGGGSMVLLQGLDPDDSKKVYEVSLARTGDSSTYDVKLGLLLRLRPDAAATGLWQEFATSGGPLRADGAWHRLQVRFDGRDASIRVDGLEHAKRAPAKPAGPAPAPAAPAADLGPRRLVMPESGTVRLTLSAPDRAFQGWVDALVLGGMFRSAEFSRELFDGLVVRKPALPVRAEFVNGRLDPEAHRAPVVLELADARNPREPAWTVTLGLDGEITAALATSGGGAAP